MPLYSCYLFYNGDVFDFFLLFMSVDKIEIFVGRTEVTVPSSALKRAHLTSDCVTNTFLTRF